jgi:hypothetical protein
MVQNIPVVKIYNFHVKYICIWRKLLQMQGKRDKTLIFAALFHFGNLLSCVLTN